MRRRRPDRPKWEDLNAREKYRFNNPYCELVELFPSVGGREHKLPYANMAIYCLCTASAHDVHHIARGGTPRWDILTNLISVNRECHRWIETYQKDGFVMCCYAKWKKGELNLAALGNIMFPHLENPAERVAGYIGNIECRYGFVADYQRMLLMEQTG